MKIGYFLSMTFLFGNIFGCQGIAQSKNQTNQPTNQNNVVVKSNPLKLRLNNEEAGTTENPSVLTKKLEEVFKNREDEGIFREGTNEIEKTVHLGADRSVSAEEIAKLFGLLNSSSVTAILIPIDDVKAVVKPNPLTLLVYAGADKYRPFNAGIEIGFIGEMSDTFPPDKATIAVAVDKTGAYSLDGKQFSASALKTEIQTRLKTKAKIKKTVFVQAENYGNMEDVAAIAHSAGAGKVYFVTKNIVQSEDGITFSLSPAFVKDKDEEQIPEFPSITFKQGKAGDSSTFQIALYKELFSKEKADAEINYDYESKKNEFKAAEVSRTEIDGSAGTLSFRNDEGLFLYQWTGSRPKDGKHQLVLVKFSCSDYDSNSCEDKANYLRSEFLQIMKSIKLN